MSPFAEREIRVLDFQAIRLNLSAYTVSDYGKEKALWLLPGVHLDQVQRQQQETSEACRLLEKGSFNLANSPDIRTSVQRAEKGGALNGVELSQVALFLQGCKRALKSAQGEYCRDNAPRIASLAESLDGCPELLRKIEGCISPEGEVLDRASLLLSELRRRKASLQRNVREKLDSYIKSPSYRRYLQEPIITIRYDRYVIPVRQEYRAQIPGVLHDQSSSGATLFIEPFSVVSLQDKQQQLIRQEQQEVERILMELSAGVTGESEAIRDDLEIYGCLDLIMARGRYSFAVKGIEPEITEEARLDIRGARHPLLGEGVVPIDFKLGGAFRVLIITGPNTGGKTVTLKTVGLMAAMAQCGLHVPVRPGTVLGVFKGIFADIGDEQSLEQSLSTFSGHLKNINEILNRAGPGTLILLDELGAGTDPSEGSALARAILLELNEKGSLVAATTHINELKMFAEQQDGMQNASVEFDSETLSPTYRLLTGIPGKSNALAVASKMGLSPTLIDRARGFLSQGHRDMEELIGNLTLEQQRLREESRIALEARNRAEILRKEVEQDKEEFSRQKEELLGKAKAEARDLLKQAKKNADEAIRKLHGIYHMRMDGQEDRRKELLAEAEIARRDLHGALDRMDNQNDQDPGETPRWEDLEVGAIVWVKSLKREAVIMDMLPGDGELRLQVGNLKLNTALNDIRMVKNRFQPQRDKETSRRSYTITRSASLSVGPEIHLRGLTLDEALEKADRYLDDALLAGLGRVVIVHGRGTGTLRKGIHAFLKSHRSVKEFRTGYPGEGGIGVTVVKLLGEGAEDDV